MSKFIEIKEKDNWNSLINSCDSTDVLQSWEWGETKKVEGWVPYRFGIVGKSPLSPLLERGEELSELAFNEDVIVLAAMVQVKKVPLLGNLAYIPHGPVYRNSSDLEKFWQEFESGLSAWAKENNVFLIEMEPRSERNIFGENWRTSGRNRQAKFKLLLDITRSEDEILSGMKKNTRYNIKLAEKKEVVVKQYFMNDPQIDLKLEKFYELLLEMQERAKGYPIRSKEYFKRLFREFRDTDKLVLFEVSYQGDVIAYNISEFTNVWASSFYASSNRLHPEVKAPYLLRWEAIKEAKRRGCKQYDFWGIVPDSKQHEGYTQNKLSFGGERIDYVGILEYPISGFKSLLWNLGLKIRGR